MIQLRKSEDRGHLNHGWLDTYHTFSFSEYFDRRFMGFRSLRVINEDRVAPAEGFDTHPHKEMEIITYVMSGELEHRDSMGNGSVIYPGEIQYMSAGTGVAHSEFNPSKASPVHLLQIWILPNQTEVPPRYDQKRFDPAELKDQLRLIASPDGVQGSVAIRQDARLYAAKLSPGVKMKAPIAADRYGWLQLTSGEVSLNDQKLKAGDGAAIGEEASLTIQGISGESELLLFDLA